METWKDIPGYEGSYQASTEGRIKSLARTEMRKDGTRNPINERILSQSKNTNGYSQLNLSRDGKPKLWRGHRLIAITFLEPDPSRRFVNHKNGIKTDNRVENLEWATQSENGFHAHATGLNKGIKGENHPMSKITNAQADEIRAKYIPYKYGTYRLAKEYGICSSIILGIIRNQRYASR